MQENVPFVPCVGLSQVPVISGVPLSACSLPSYVTSVGGTGRSYTFLNWTRLVSGSKLPRRVKKIVEWPSTSAESSKYPAPKAVTLALVSASRVSDHRMGLVGTVGSCARHSGEGHASPTHRPATTSASSGFPEFPVPPPRALAMLSTSSWTGATLGGE